MRKTLLLLFISCLFTSALYAQTATVKGKLANKETTAPMGEVQVAIPSLNLLTNSDANGDFKFDNVPYGNYEVVVGGETIQGDTLKANVNSPVVDMGTASVDYNDKNISARSIQIPTITLESNGDIEGDDNKAQNVSSILTASRDPFLSAASFVFGSQRFQPRGYDRNQQEVLINGVPMNDIETGDASWSQWGGLNDVFRARSTTYGLAASENTFGGLNGSIYMDATALAQRKQTRVSYSLSNRQYHNRIMLTHSSGLTKKGWAYSLSASTRWANEGYIDGTFYEGYSYFLAVSKKIKTKHQLNFTTFGAPTRRGKSAPAIQEAYDLAGTNFYNPNWGFQTDKDGNEIKRNAKVANSFQPIFILNYQYNPNKKTEWNVGAAYQFGRYANSAIDWYNAADPRPDYYRYLPSYQTVNDNPAAAEVLKAKVMADPEHNLQIDWDRLYNANFINTETIYNVNGVEGDNVTGKRSLYVVSNDVDYLKKWSFNTTLQHAFGDHITGYTGLSYINQQVESYKELQDLLGGDFFVNYNQFAARDYVGNADFYQNDANNPNAIIKEGDKYGYDYINRFNKAWWWGQAVFTFNKIDFFVAANVGTNSFQREGLFKNGLFADNSFGKSEKQSFLTDGVKGGVTYKINGRNYLFVNGGFAQDAPELDNTYISSRTRNSVVNDVTAQKSMSLEGGYLLRAPSLNIRAVGYTTEVTDATLIKRFYNDDPSFQTFVNYVLQGVNTRFVGTELAVEVKVSPSFTVNAVAALGQAFYTDRPNVSVFKDNDTSSVFESREVYIKNYYLAVGPQSCYTAGLNYRSKRYWYANINLNFFDRNYVDVNPDRLTPQTTDLIEPGSEKWHAILDQEKLPSAFTVDLFAGKSFSLNKLNKKIPYGTFLYVNVGVNNILNNKDIITGGFEQLRYDFTDNNPNKFPSKYFYGFGANYFINLALKF